MLRNKWVGIFPVFLALFFCASSHAQKTYRCGSIYQDRPCEDAKNSKEVGYLGSTAAASTAQSLDQQCKQRGLDSQKIVWARQSGVLAEKLIADLANKGMDSNKVNGEKELITAVYQKQRGSAPEIGAAIEADCVEAKKQAALAAAMVAAGMKLQGQNATGAEAAATSSSASVQASGKAQSETPPTTKVATNNTALCSSLAARIDMLKSSQRAGGSVSHMENMNRLRVSAESERSRAGC